MNNWKAKEKTKNEKKYPFSNLVVSVVKLYKNEESILKYSNLIAPQEDHQIHFAWPDHYKTDMKS